MAGAAKEPHEQSLSPEIISSLEMRTQFDDRLNEFLVSLPSTALDKDGDWCIMECAHDFTDGSHVVCVSALFLYHLNFGVVRREFVRIKRGTGDHKAQVDDDFSFEVNSTTSLDEPVSFDDAGKLIMPEAAERMVFRDNAAIKNHMEALLDDLSFDDRTPIGVTLPRLQVTPGGEIYKNGVEAVGYQQLGAVGVGFMVGFCNEDEQDVLERKAAAYWRAFTGVGTGLTEERMARVIAVMERIQPQP